MIHMAHLFGSIQGQSGPSTRIGSKRSGISAYVQTWTGRIAVNMRHNQSDERDYGNVVLTTGPSGSGRTIDLTGDIDVAAIVQAASFDEITRNHLDTARRVIQRADKAAAKAIERRDRLARRAA